MSNYDRNQGPLQATHLRTVSLLAAILLAAAAAVSCNVSESSATINGQANGDLQSTLPNLHDMRRRFRDHHWTSAMVVETAHHQQRSS